MNINITNHHFPQCTYTSKVEYIYIQICNHIIHISHNFISSIQVYNLPYFQIGNQLSHTWSLSLIYTFVHNLSLPVEPFGIKKDTRIVGRLVQCQRPRRGLTCNHISMPLSQTGSYTNQIRCQCPRHGLTRKHKSMPTSQTWSYTITHIGNPMSWHMYPIYS